MGYVPNKVGDFNRRTLTKKGVAVEYVELITRIDNRQFTYQQSHKALSMFFLSRPSDDGFSIEIVEKGTAPYTDVMGPDDDETKLRRWQKEALGLAAGGVGESAYRRQYTAEGDALNEAKRIWVVLRINGNEWLSAEAREPGLMGFVMDGRGGFDIHIIGPTKRTDLRDRLGPPKDPMMLYPWQIDALELNRG